MTAPPPGPGEPVAPVADADADADADTGTEIGAGGHGANDHEPAAERARRRPVSAIAAAVVGVVVLGLVGVLATRDSAVDAAASSPLVGRVAPLIEGEVLGGGEFRLDDHRGRWVVVNYFATWCVPCRVEHPELVRWSARHAPVGDARIVSVVFDDQPAEVAAFFEKEGGDWPVVLDDGRIALAYGVAGIPESYLVDPDGFVVAKITGGVTADGLDLLIAEAEAARGSR